ncbi:MAG: CHRD domain-containing protein [Phycisphaeraceae bacterium]|nr:CHRD domain-containing protein [Phycisphaeraceae bacterium]
MKSSCCVVFVLSALLATQAQAVVHNVNVFLDGLQEVPPVATPATGTATVLFDDVTGDMTVTGSFSDLIGTANNAHVHGYSGPGVNSAALIPLTFTAATSGTFSGNGVVDIANTLAGLTYINVHSTFRPGGEIRGQIIIPEPASAGLLGACAGAALLRRRR